MLECFRYGRANKCYHEILLRPIYIHRIDNTDHFARRFIYPSEGFTNKRSQKRGFSRSRSATHITKENIPCCLALSAIGLAGPCNKEGIRPDFIWVSQVCQESKGGLVVKKGSHAVKRFSGLIVGARMDDIRPTSTGQANLGV